MITGLKYLITHDKYLSQLVYVYLLVKVIVDERKSII